MKKNKKIPFFTKKTEPEVELKAEEGVTDEKQPAFVNVVNHEAPKTKIKVEVSSKIDVCSPDNVLEDNEKEWVSDGDHKNAWIKLSFSSQLIKTVSFADRMSPDASMVSGALTLRLNGQVVHEVTISPVGDGGVNHLIINFDGIKADSVMIQASEKSWGSDIGLRFFNINQ